MTQLNWMDAVSYFEIATFLRCYMGFSKGRFYRDFFTKTSKVVSSRKKKESFPVVFVCFSNSVRLHLNKNHWLARLLILKMFWKFWKVWWRDACKLKKIIDLVLLSYSHSYEWIFSWFAFSCPIQYNTRFLCL